MIVKDVPTPQQLINMLDYLGGTATAYALCKEFVYRDYDRQTVQLAMQRATDKGYIKINKDWSMTKGDVEW